LPNNSLFLRPDFFSGARLNFAENLLYPAKVNVDDLATAVVTVTEDELHTVTTTWAELREDVRRGSNSLRAAGVQEGDIVAGFVSNHVQALVAMLSATALGAIWTGISPDNGVSAVLDRLGQIGPKVLFADNATLYNGKEWSSAEKTLQIVEELKKSGLSLVVVVNNLKSVRSAVEEIRSKGVKTEDYDQFLQRYHIFGLSWSASIADIS